MKRSVEQFIERLRFLEEDSVVKVPPSKKTLAFRNTNLQAHLVKLLLPANISGQVITFEDTRSIVIADLAFV